MHDPLVGPVIAAEPRNGVMAHGDGLDPPGSIEAGGDLAAVPVRDTASHRLQHGLRRPHRLIGPADLPGIEAVLPSLGVDEDGDVEACDGGSPVGEHLVVRPRQAVVLEGVEGGPEDEVDERDARGDDPDPSRGPRVPLGAGSLGPARSRRIWEDRRMAGNRSTRSAPSVR